jgi:hypothetical protein
MSSSSGGGDNVGPPPESSAETASRLMPPPSSVARGVPPRGGRGVAEVEDEVVWEDLLMLLRVCIMHNA